MGDPLRCRFWADMQRVAEPFAIPAFGRQTRRSKGSIADIARVVSYSDRAAGTRRREREPWLTQRAAGRVSRLHEGAASCSVRRAFVASRR